MSDIVSIEFDRAVFEEKPACIKWLQENPEYNSVTELRKFQLKRSRHSKFMASEERDVWAWQGNMALCPTIHIQRPHAYIVVLRRGPGALFQPCDMPTPSSKFQNQKARQAAKLYGSIVGAKRKRNGKEEASHQEKEAKDRARKDRANAKKRAKREAAKKAKAAEKAADLPKPHTPLGDVETTDILGLSASDIADLASLSDNVK